MQAQLEQYQLKTLTPRTQRQIIKLLRRIMTLSTAGYKETIENNRPLNWIFLRIMIETNKIRNIIREDTI